MTKNCMKITNSTFLRQNSGRHGQTGIFIFRVAGLPQSPEAWRHNFYPRCHKQNYVTCKFYFRCGNLFDQSLVTFAFLWEKLLQLQFYTDLLKKLIFWGLIWFKFNNLGLVLGPALTFYSNATKGWKPKVIFLSFEC